MCILTAACWVKNRLLGTDQSVSKNKCVGGGGELVLVFMFLPKALYVNASFFAGTQGPAWC